MTIQKITVFLAAAAFLVAAPLANDSWAKKAKSSVIGSPYEKGKPSIRTPYSTRKKSGSRSSSRGRRSSDNLLKKSGRGIKNGAVKVKDGVVWSGRKIKSLLTPD